MLTSVGSFGFFLMLYYSCFFSFLGIIKYEGLHNLVYRVNLASLSEGGVCHAFNDKIASFYCGAIGYASQPLKTTQNIDL
jgi:hypothetical protein